MIIKPCKNLGQHLKNFLDFKIFLSVIQSSKNTSTFLQFPYFFQQLKRKKVSQLFLVSHRLIITEEKVIMENSL